MNKLTKIFVSCLFACLAAHQVLGAADLRYVSSLAAAVVVGTVQNRTETADKVSFNLVVQRALKGGDLAAGTVLVTHPWRYRGILLTPAKTTTAQSSGIWFLTPSNPGWDVLPVGGQDGIFTNLFLPANVSGIRQYTYDDSISVTEKVVYEMGDGIKEKGGDVLSQMHLLDYASTPATNKVLKDLLQHSSASVRSGALAALLMNSRPGTLQALVQNWPTFSDEVSQFWVLHALEQGFRDTSPASVAQLIAIAQDNASPPKLRAAAIYALRSIHTKETLPFFATLLSSADTNDQMDAVVAISSFANGCPPQTRSNLASMEYMMFENPSVFRNESTIANFAVGSPAEKQKLPTLVKFWTDWWARNQAALTLPKE